MPFPYSAPRAAQARDVERAGFTLLLFTAFTIWFVAGWTGLAYALVFVGATIPGWPIGRALFGRGHPAAWICGSLIGYGLTAVALWLPIALHAAWWLPFFCAWAATTAAALALCRRVDAPLAPLPPWPRQSTAALALVLAMAPALVALPYRHVGQRDEQGGRRYRAYFTADFVWHEALTAEVARFASPPRNPYMASQPLHYYWGYFLLPSAVAGATSGRDVPRSVEPLLKVNALCAGMLFVGAIFMAAWAALPRARIVAVAVGLTVIAASAEGLYEVVDLQRRGLPLDLLRTLNIDAITSWFFYGLTIDGLPRSLWYGPQHATSSALGLVALTIATRTGRDMTARAAACAGLALALGLMMSPFPAGVMALTYGLAVLWDAALRPRLLPRVILVQSAAVLIVALGLGWCLYNGTFEGAGGAVEIGLSRSATRDPITILGLALGPILVPAMLGVVVVAARRFPLGARPALMGIVVAAGLFFCVTLVLEPVWIGWRAGQQFLVTVPALIAFALAGIADRLGRIVAAAFAALVLIAGAPTTFIDLYNAQDTTNVAKGPGFRWTVVLTPGEQEALDWIDTHTPPDAVVQMSLEPRGRETWSLIPSFAKRRMAAGLPISLLRTPEYETMAARADRLFSTADSIEAAFIARELAINYIYVGREEREAFGPAAEKFAERTDLFARVFANGDAAVYAVR